MGPACDLDDVAGLVEVIVDGGGIGDEVALVAGEQAVDRVAVVRVRIAIEDVALGRDEHPEVGAPALLLGLDEDAGGVGAQVGLGEGVAQHRLDERLGEVGELLVPAAHRRAREHQAVAGVDLRETIQREVVLPAAHDRVGEHPGTGEAAVDRELGRLRDQRRLVARFVGERHALPGRLALVLRRRALDELRPHDPDRDHRGGPALEHLADFLADPRERVEAFSLDLDRQHLDLHPREMLG
jgi:hypothetical protein